MGASSGGDFNVNTAASSALQGALGTTGQAMGFRPMTMRPERYDAVMQKSAGTQRAVGYEPAQQQTYTLAGTNIGQYQNPYQQQVIDTAMRDINRQQQKSLNQLGAQATQAGAFGGDRFALESAETRRGFAETAADTAAQLRQQGYGQALGAAQFDVGQQTAAEAANVAAQQAAQRFGAESQYGAQAANLARQQQINAANAAAQTAANQFGAQAGMNVQQQNIANQMAANTARLNAAQQMAGLGQQAFGIGQTIQQNQAQQGLLQQGIQQALIDAAKGQFAGYTNAPMASLQAPLAALGAAPNVSTTTQSMQPGLTNYLQLGAQVAPFFMSDARLKTNIAPKGEKGGVKFYTWDWNEAGKKVADPAQPTFGVIADELQETHPHLVVRGDDGYLRVNYAGLASELENAA
jgi:hypothetical protein